MLPIFYPKKEERMFSKNKLGIGEQVFALPADKVNALFKRQVQRCDFDEIEELSQLSEYAIVANRSDLEGNPLWKQVITYIYAEYRTARSIFVYKRNRGEVRLSGLYSIGVGGHISIGDVIDGEGLELIIYKAARRELFEEVRLRKYGALQYTNIINDNSNSVGRDHIGIVMRVYVDSDEYKLNEPGSFIEEHCGYVPIKSLGNLEYESWSQLLVNSFNKS